MIPDSQLFRISIAVAVIGTVALFFAVEFVLKPENVPIARIDRSFLGKEVAVTANVSGYAEKDGVIFLTLEEGNAAIKSVMFRRAGTAVNGIIDGDAVAVTGKVSDYMGELEIIIKDIRRI